MIFRRLKLFRGPAKPSHLAQELRDADLAIRDNPLVQQCLAQASWKGAAETDRAVLDAGDMRALLTAAAAAEPERSRLDRSDRSGPLLPHILEAFVQRNGFPLRRGHCLQFGIGTGDATCALAARFAQITVLDPSPVRVAEFNTRLARRRIKNVRVLLFDDPEVVQGVPPVDLILSGWGLPSLPPPLQRHLLATCFALLTEEGAALLLLRDWKPDLATETAQGAPPFCLAKPQLLGLARAAHLTLRDVVPQICEGTFGSYLFYFVKDKRGAPR